MKKTILTGLICFLSFQLFSQQFDHLIDCSRLIIKFGEDMEDSEKRQILRQVDGLSDHLVFLESPDVVIAYTDPGSRTGETYQSLYNKCLGISTLTYVGPYLKNEEGTEFGVLDKVYFKLENAEVNYATPEWFFQRAYQIPEVRKSATFKDVFEISGVKSGLDILDMAVQLNQGEWTSFAEPGYLLHPDANADDPIIPSQWAIENLGTPQQGNGTPGADMKVKLAWQITTGDPNTKVAVMDSGVDTIHFDLVDNLLPGFDAFGEGTNGYPTPNFSDDGHGTACAGIIAAKGNNGQGIAGIAYDASIIPVRIFRYADTSLMGVPLGVIPVSTSDVLASGIQWAWQNGADIQSHSWSLPDLFLNAGILPGNPALVEMAIAEAAAMGRGGKGSLLFFSSGNEGAPPNWPGRLPDAMTVNATSMCDEAKTPSSCDGQDWTGNWGAELDFGAPGVRIYTTDMMAANGYNNGIYNCCFGGTSAACPNVSGVAALLLSFDPTLTLAESREILSRSCEKVGGYAYDSLAVYGSWTPELGYGRINAYQALLEAGADPVSIEIPVMDDQLTIFPNPAGEQVFIDWQGQQVAEFISIFSVLGQQVVFSDFVSELDVSHLPEGVYFVKISFVGSGSVTRKLIVNR